MVYRLLGEILLNLRARLLLRQNSSFLISTEVDFFWILLGLFKKCSSSPAGKLGGFKAMLDINYTFLALFEALIGFFYYANSRSVLGLFSTLDKECT